MRIENPKSEIRNFDEMIEVFKTDVQKVSQANKLITLLQEHFPNIKINFDLQDCDKILRLEGIHFTAEKVTFLVKENGFACMALE